MWGGDGNDTFYIDNAGDIVVEAVGEGTDWVRSTVDFTLGANVENLILEGSAIEGRGNALGNFITGNAANNILRGGGGNDLIDGGLGSDTVIFRGVSSEYTITAISGGYLITDSVAGRDGGTTVRNIETAQFTNTSISLGSAAPGEPHPHGPPPEEAWGLFDGAPGADPGFGFFEPMPEVPDEAAPAAKAQAAAADAGPRGGAPAGHAGDTSIRVAVEKVDALINLVGELVITQAMLAQNARTLDPVHDERMLQGLAQLDRNTRALQESVMSVRMTPIGVVFNRFPRVVRDLAARLEKKVRLTMEGEATELDKGLIERIADPLTHLVRNSLDHGIEMPADREAAGKLPTGTVHLRAFHRGGSIVIEVSDDGAGLNRERILAKARERGMNVTDAMPDSEVWGLIFAAGFSTAAVVTDVSGRGVGMDVVSRNVAEMGGSIDIDSVAGRGTTIAIRLPLTLAIMDGMSIGVGSETYIIPLASVIESLQVADGQIHTVANRGLVIHVRGEQLPVISMHELFPTGGARGERASGVIVIVEADKKKAALLVDELLGQHQVVVKSLDRNYRRVRGVSGATIMGDGRVAIILDVAALVRPRMS